MSTFEGAVEGQSAADYNREYNKEWRKRNKDKCVLYSKRRRHKHPLRCAASEAKRRGYPYAAGEVERWERAYDEATTCQLCGRSLTASGHRRKVVDHDHRTGLIRGIICRGCNSAIGALGDSIGGLMQAVNYMSGNRPSAG